MVESKALIALLIIILSAIISSTVILGFTLKDISETMRSMKVALWEIRNKVKEKANEQEAKTND